MQLRDQEGRLQTYEEEFEQIVQYYSQLYAGPSMPIGSMCHPIHITVEEMEFALRSMAPRKVLPPGYAPSALWRNAKEEIAPSLLNEFNYILKGGPIRLPEAWCKSFLILLPKPGKPLKTPADLRPISLLPPCAKILAFILAQRIIEHAINYLKSVPQFAYVPEGGIYNALDRVMCHSGAVRKRLSTQGYNLDAKHAGIHKQEITGGIQISMDIHKAYDHLPCWHLEAALEEAQVEPHII